MTDFAFPRFVDCCPHLPRIRPAFIGDLFIIVATVVLVSTELSGGAVWAIMAVVIVILQSGHGVSRLTQLRLAITY